MEKKQELPAGTQAAHPLKDAGDPIEKRTNKHDEQHKKDAGKPEDSFEKLYEDGIRRGF